MKYEARHYPDSCGNDLRTEIKITDGVAWIAHLASNGSGAEVKKLAAGDTWQEGAEELIGFGVYTGLYETEEEARAACDRMFGIAG